MYQADAAHGAGSASGTTAELRSGGRDLDGLAVALLLKAVERNPNLHFETAASFRDALLALPKKDW